MLYKQLDVTVNSSTLQDGGVGFNTLIGFSLDLSALPKLSCSTDQTYKCLGSQLWAFLSSEESKKATTVITRERKHFSQILESDCKPSTCLACSYLNWLEEVSTALCSACDYIPGTVVNVYVLALTWHCPSYCNVLISGAAIRNSWNSTLQKTYSTL